MTHSKHIVILTDEERQELRSLTMKGVHSARVIKRAQVLLLADAGDDDRQIAAKGVVCKASAYNIRRNYSRCGLTAALYEKARPGAPAKFDGLQRAKITALACSPVPEGHARWTLELLADKAVELRYVESISGMHVSNILKKTT